MRLIAAIATYIVISFFLFGGPLRGIFLALISPTRFGAPLSWLLVFPAIFLGAFAARYAALRGAKPFVPAVILVAVTVPSATLLVVSYGSILRQLEIQRFEPDVEVRASLWRSLHNAPDDFQFFLHGAALKDCVPYAWSWRSMEYYPLAPNIAVNVLPPDWVAQCHIVRER